MNIEELTEAMKKWKEENPEAHSEMIKEVIRKTEERLAKESEQTTPKPEWYDRRYTI